jgi:hypothetical protein
MMEPQTTHRTRTKTIDSALCIHYMSIVRGIVGRVTVP